MGQVRQTGRFLRRWWPVVVAAALMVVVAAFASLFGIINTSAHNYARVAQQDYGGGEVDALIRAVGDERRPLPDRNHAVWALGQFRQARALPALTRHYTGEKCQHDKFLCQSELRKAIDLCSGRTKAPWWLEKTLGWAHPKASG
jgi:hypothetical protein